MGAKKNIPLPIIAKDGRKKHYLITLERKIYAGILDPHTKAFTKTNKLTKTPIEEITRHELFHCYKSHNRIFAEQ